MKKLVLLISLVSLSAPLSSPVLAMEKGPSEEPETHSRSPRTPEGINVVVIATAKEVYQKINENWTYVAPGRQSAMSTASTMWNPKWINGLSLVDGEKKETLIPTLVLKASPKKLTSALNDLIAKPASLECTIALTTVKIFCLSKILGKKRFERYATGFYKELQRNPKYTVEDFFHELPLQFLTQIEDKAIPGSITYITNIPQYPLFKPNGNGKGSNVFCTGDDQYLGFSAIYKPGPQPLETIEAQDLALFIKQEDVEKKEEQHKSLSQVFKTHSQLFTITRRKEQGKVEFYQFFDLKEIDKFCRTGIVYMLD